MKNKNLLIAVIVLGVLGAIAFFTSNNGQSNQSSDKSGIGKEVVTKLDPTKISKITITDKDGSVSLEMKDEKWITLPSKEVPVSELIPKINGVDIPMSSDDDLNSEEILKMSYHGNWWEVDCEKAEEIIRKLVKT